MAADPLHRIFLTGPSGTGKSAVAQLVAERLGWRALDTDRLIEEAEGRPIAEIFARDGEARFRELERDALRNAASEEQVVVATGGGAVIAEENRRRMADGGLVICLEAQPQTLQRRLEEPGSAPAAERPLLAGDDLRARIAELKSQRFRYYMLADLIIETDAMAAQEIAETVAATVSTSDPTFSGGTERLLLPEERSDPPPAEPVQVTAGGVSYPAIAGWGALDMLGDLLREAGLSGAVHVVSDTDVLARHGDRVRLALQRAGFDVAGYAIKPGEASKTFEVACTLYDWLVSRRAERGDAIVALGGGVVGDLAGFVAATYLRGVPLVQAPTSLLAMVDASIGGKVAVDHKEGKNLVGAFYQPRLVVADVATLKTLPQRTLIGGCAEVIKHAFILDPALLDDLEARADDLLLLEPAFTTEIVRRNVAIKASVVAEDERDAGRRAVLNYGHTAGHAIEAVTGYRGVLHGEAISAGMMAAAEIGRRLGVTPQAVVERQRALLERFGLPARGPRLDADAVLAAMALDKKVAGGVVRWVLLEDVGRAVVRADVPQEIVREVVSEILS